MEKKRQRRILALEYHHKGSNYWKRPSTINRFVSAMNFGLAFMHIFFALRAMHSLTLPSSFPSPYFMHIILLYKLSSLQLYHVRSLLLPYILFLLCMHFSNMIKMVRIFVSFDKFDQGKISFWIGVNWSCAKSIIELLTSRTYHSTLIQL